MGFVTKAVSRLKIEGGNSRILCGKSSNLSEKRLGKFNPRETTIIRVQYRPAALPDQDRMRNCIQYSRVDYP
jgi:hypothetical protein